MASGGPGWGNLPIFNFNTTDVAGSYKLWKSRFRIFLRLKEATEKLEPEIKKLTLLSVVGEDGLSLLSAKGIDPLEDTVGYDNIITELDEHFCRETSLYLRVQNFVTVS